jgi:hypothetical protein
VLLQKPWALEEPLVKPRSCIGIGEERSKAGVVLLRKKKFEGGAEVGYGELEGQG